MRLFIALPLPEVGRLSLIAYQQMLRRHLNDNVRWTSHDQLHLTLKFLGETPDDLLPALGQLVREAAAGAQPISARWSHSLGAFPHLQAPRVLWRGLQEGAEAVSQLAARLESAVVALGLPAEERSFAAHVTLGRVRPAAVGRRLAAAIEPVEGETFLLGRLELIESVLLPQGPQYTTRVAASLGVGG